MVPSEISSFDGKTWKLVHCLSTLVLNFASEFFASVSNIAAGFIKLSKLLGITDVAAILSAWPESVRVPRSRIERPESFLDGISAGFFGSLQLVGGSILTLKQFITRREVESGVGGFLKGVIQRLAFLFGSPAVATLIFVTAAAAGVSCALRHKPVIEKIRPRRVFPPQMTVLQYGPHTARAMTLLETGTKKNLVEAMLQPGIAAFPLPQSRITHSRRRRHFEEGAKTQAKDYLLVTSDFLVCLCDGHPQWVCRKEDIRECSVKMPAFLLGALLAQKDLFLRYRGKKEASYAHEGTDNSAAKPQKPFNEQASLCVVQIKVANKLRLPDKVLRNFSAAYKAYLSHATAKQSVVQALKDSLGLHCNNSAYSIVLGLPSVQACHADDQNAMRLDKAISIVEVEQACTRLDPPSRRSHRTHCKKGKLAGEITNIQISDDCSLRRSGRSEHSFPWFPLRCQAFCRRRAFVSHRNSVDANSRLSSRLQCTWLRSLWSTNPPHEPDEVIFTIGAPDGDIALQIFDALCSTLESYVMAKQSGETAATQHLAQSSK